MDNPFAPPAGTIGDYHDPANPGTSYQVVGKTIVGDNSLSLPRICVTCGIDAPHGTRMDKKLYYCSPLVVLFILLSIIIVLIAYFIARKRVDVAYTLCPECNAKHTSRRIICGLSWAAFFISLFLAFSAESATFGWSAFGAFILSLVMSYLASGPIKVTKHHRGSFTYAGFGKRFLDRLR